MSISLLCKELWRALYVAIATYTRQPHKTCVIYLSVCIAHTQWAMCNCRLLNPQKSGIAMCTAMILCPPHTLFGNPPRWEVVCNKAPSHKLILVMPTLKILSLSVRLLGLYSQTVMWLCVCHPSKSNFQQAMSVLKCRVAQQFEHQSHACTFLDGNIL